MKVTLNGEAKDVKHYPFGSGVRTDPGPVCHDC